MEAETQSHGKRRRGRKVSKVEGQRAMPRDGVEALRQWAWGAAKGCPAGWVIQFGKMGMEL